MPAQFGCTLAQHEQVKALRDNEVPAKKIGAPVHLPIGYSAVLVVWEGCQGFGKTETPLLLWSGQLK